MKDLFGNEVIPLNRAMTPAERKKFRNKRNSNPRGHADRPGTGPEGETCGSCKNCYFVTSRGARRFYKCKLVKRTAGAGTDIRKKHKACSYWEKKDDTKN